MVPVSDSAFWPLGVRDARLPSGVACWAGGCRGGRADSVDSAGHCGAVEGRAPGLLCFKVVFLKDSQKGRCFKHVDGLHVLSCKPAPFPALCLATQRGAAPGASPGPSRPLRRVLVWAGAPGRVRATLQTGVCWPRSRSGAGAGQHLRCVLRRGGRCQPWSQPCGQGRRAPSAPGAERVGTYPGGPGTAVLWLGQSGGQRQGAAAPDGPGWGHRAAQSSAAGPQGGPAALPSASHCPADVLGDSRLLMARRARRSRARPVMQKGLRVRHPWSRSAVLSPEVAASRTEGRTERSQRPRTPAGPGPLTRGPWGAVAGGPWAWDPAAAAASRAAPVHTPAGPPRLAARVPGVPAQAGRGSGAVIASAGARPAWALVLILDCPPDSELIQESSKNK